MSEPSSRRILLRRLIISSLFLFGTGAIVVLVSKFLSSETRYLVPLVFAVGMILFFWFNSGETFRSFPAHLQTKILLLRIAIMAIIAVAFFLMFFT